MRYLYGNLTFIVISVVFFTVYFTRFLDERTSSSSGADPGKQRKRILDQHDFPTSNKGSEAGQEIRTKERKDIFFLKTHKCGSSTVQNILMRYGLNEGLDFVLPERGNYLGSPTFFIPTMIGKSIRTPNRVYNIFTHHNRFNHTSTMKVMSRNSVYVTILRKPAELYESLYNYYNFEKRYHMNLTTFLENYSTVERFKRGGSKFGYNQMCFDLGLNEKQFDSNGKIKQWIHEIDRTFDLVLMTEYMEESLILLADLMKWPLKRVVFLKLNERKSTNKLALSAAQRKIVRKLNKCDTKLHDYFFKKFKQRIRSFGVERMNTKLREFIRLNDEFSRECDVKVAESKLSTVRYQTTNTLDSECVHAVSSELVFTSLLRNIQRQRVTKLRSLKNLMKNTNDKAA
ncbi:unnamed protein product [Bemisia tabaci]|uniref:Galactosylceramide sulfotransferase-like n=1 Tax=Bemisia tabaci TaxID=7038 RepID=A0A9P0A4D0_BEMTA|nr:unnamed protein product [Bemisia tabaci]